MTDHTAEKDAAVRVRCPGVGTPALNVSRGWVGNRLPMVGDCQDCGQRPEITRKWTVKYHTTHVLSPAQSADRGQR